MKTPLLLLLALVLQITTIRAQQGFSVKGAVTDTDLRIHLFSAAINVLNAKDSTLQKFTHVNNEGTFSVNGLPAGKYILLAVYPDYADYVETFSLGATNPAHDFGNISMRQKERLLHEVLVKGAIKAIQIKGDTTEFNARAYVIQPNDKVEDLIRQLPGMQVDQNGKITANGVAVTKVLLDGEEFFGDDPTLITQNIRADMVDKLQLYDKKSDQAVFTGIDDGIKIKTINVILKEDRKKGVFGKAVGGIGNNDYHEAQGIYNKFAANYKYALYGTIANDGKAGLGYADQDKIGASTMTTQIIGGITYNNQAFDPDFQTTYNGNGLPLARSAGGHFDGKFGIDNNQSVNVNYKIGSLETDGYQSVETQQTLPGNAALNSNQLRNFDNYSFKQKLDLTYTLKIDTTSDLKISADGAEKHAHNKSNTLTTTTDGSANLVNQLNSGLDNSFQERIYNFNALYTKKLRGGRTFSWNVSENYDRTTVNAYQQSTVNYYQVGVVDSTTQINQYKPQTITNSVLSSNMTFSQILTKKLAVVVNYGLSYNSSTQNLNTYNQSSPGNYNALVDSLSSNYQFNQLINQVGVNFNYKYGKVIMNLGALAADAEFRQVNESNSAVLKRTFINWLPRFYLQYRPSQSSFINVTYNGNTMQPTLAQLQPVAINTDPTNIVVGNPNLKPSFNNNFYVWYNASQALTQSYFSFTLNYTFIADPIVSDISTNSAGKSVTQWVNLFNNDPYNAFFHVGYGLKIKPIDVNTGLAFEVRSNSGYSIVNTLLDKSVTTKYTLALNLSKSKAKKYSINIDGGPGYSFSNFSLQPLTNNNAPVFNLNSSGTLYLPANLQIASNIRYEYAGKTQSEVALERAIWNGSISKTFLKDDQLKFSLAVNNILNQNPTLVRNITANMISQSFYSTVQRYFMFSVTWDFTKFGMSPAN